MDKGVASGQIVIAIVLRERTVTRMFAPGAGTQVGGEFSFKLLSCQLPYFSFNWLGLDRCHQRLSYLISVVFSPHVLPYHFAHFSLVAVSFQQRSEVGCEGI